MLPMIENGGEGSDNELRASSYVSPFESLWDLAKRDRKAVAAITDEDRISSGVVSKSGLTSALTNRNNQVAM